MTCQLLVSKLGRSSKPSPRFLVLVCTFLFLPLISLNVHAQANRTLYLLITQLVQNRNQTTIERQIPLGTIRSVATSTLRDDWLVRYILCLFLGQS